MAGRRVPLTLGTQSNPGRYGYDGAGRLINCYVEGRGKEGRAELPLYVVDGLASFATLTGGAEVRAMIYVSPFLYVVSGRQVFKVDGSGTVTTLGGLASDGPVYMARNRRSPDPQIGIVCDGTYKVIQGGVLSDVADSDLPPPSYLTDLDGYFIFGVPNGRMYASGIDDATTIDALDFAVAESHPDDITRIATRGREVVPFGEKSTEFWTNTGETNFPLSRVQAVPIGCPAGRTVANVGQTLAFVANDDTVCMFNGYQPVPISNPAVNTWLEGVADKSTLSATAWERGNHKFYALSGADRTWVCDLSQGNQWHERKSYNLARWRVSCVEKIANGRLIAGHYDAGTLYEIDPDTLTEGADPIQVDARLTLNGFPYRATCSRIELDVIPGVGLNSTNTDAASPTLQISSSEDHETFGAERSRSIGTINQALTTVDAWRFGQIRPTGRTFRFTTSSPVVRGIMSAWATIERER